MLIETIFLLFSIPAGYLIAWMARDELVLGRKWFRYIILASVFSVGWFSLTRNNSIVFASLFILIIAFIAHMKSKDKNWTNKQI